MSASIAISTVGVMSGVVMFYLAAYDNSSNLIGSGLGSLNIPNGTPLSRYSMTATTPNGTSYIVPVVALLSGLNAAAYGISFRRCKVERGITPSLYSQESDFAALGIGPNSAPVFVGPATQSPQALQAGQALGLFLGVQVFTASGTYTPGTYTIGGRTVTATKGRVRGIGGGGSGGSCSAAGSSQGSAGSGGNAGAYGEIFIASGLSTQTITIGAGGIPAAAGSNPGGAGGNSSFGGLAIFGGGSGGLGGIAATPPFSVIPSYSQASCSGSGAFVVSGKGASAKQSFGISSGVVNGSNGADSLWGAGGWGAGGGAGGGASGYGSGGGGAGVGAGGAANTGGAGAPGIIIVEEFA
ncbi:hypothetical protein [Burkholderia sp. TSV86]|uniref:hypothetical protein n=1 Tax=Burkholderia sp. TSV86 TaxID=1385594 RepID=UPI0012E34BF8|nr:hypothetical protein [Burkholderia sp. TSV86]